ncbi:MATE family efflux transporter [Kushneria phosphatilytica]|uniref:MATE family efflux transporter n=1 Tax=Kushneria phosphatilytica TaxID=657387 RepID=A0A5C1A3C1_9GAMM|nr:MATE family efflux transporter [Kushneria phosphatilytica]QEL12564.1 MATE family efflux transporter [Kushneria phosphatilytica]
MPRRADTSLLEGPVLASLLRLAVPIVLANVLQSLYQLIDAFWVGRLGGHAVAAVSVCFPITFLLIALGSGLGVAGSTLVAQYMGAGQHRMVNRVAAQTLLMVALVSIGLSLLGEWLAPSLLKLLGVAPEVYDGALIFLRFSLAAMIFTFGFAMFQSLMRGIGEVRTPLYIVAGTVVLNVVLDPLLIFGLGPIPGLGVGGAALATLITQALALMIGLRLLLRGRWTIQPAASDFRPDWPFIRRAFRLGFPASIELSARALSMNVMVFLVSGFGTVTIAAYGVGTNVLSFVIIPALGLSMSTAALVGQNIGAGQFERAARIARLSAAIAFVTLSLVGALVFVFATALVRFFVPADDAVIATGGRFLHTVALTFGFMGLQMALTGVFRATGQTLVAMVLTLVSQWVLQFPLAFVLSRDAVLGQSGIWWAFPVTNVVIALITVAWFARGDWMKQRLTTVDEDPVAERVTEEVLAEEHR